jgi:SET domain-containing protein
LVLIRTKHLVVLSFFDKKNMVYLATVPVSCDHQQSVVAMSGPILNRCWVFRDVTSTINLANRGNYVWKWTSQ